MDLNRLFIDPLRRSWLLPVIHHCRFDVFSLRRFGNLLGSGLKPSRFVSALSYRGVLQEAVKLLTTTLV